jgi:hypothetical protein
MEIITNRPIMTSTDWNNIDFEGDLGSEDYSMFITKGSRSRSKTRRADRKTDRTDRKELELGLRKLGTSRKDVRVGRRAGRKANRINNRSLRKLNKAERQTIFTDMKTATVDWWEKRKKNFDKNQLERRASRLKKKKAGTRALTVDEEKSGSPENKMQFKDHIPEVKKDAAGNTFKDNPDGTTTPLDGTEKIVTKTNPAGDQMQFDENDFNNRNLNFDDGGNPYVNYGEDEVIEIRTDEGKPEIVPEASAEQGWWKSLKGWQKGALIGGAILVIAGTSYLIYRQTKK